MSKRNREKRQAFFGRLEREKRRIYPYYDGTPEASLPLVDQLLLSPDVHDSLKDHIREATIIDATSVSNYYWYGTDQEYWDLSEDMPNIAPPFETFLLTFQAPPQSVSKVYGVTQWHENSPVEWAVLCLGIDNTQTMERLHTEEGQARLIQGMRQVKAAYEPKFLNRFLSVPRTEWENVRDSLSGTEKVQVAELALAHQILAAHENGTLQQYIAENMVQALQNAPTRWGLCAYLFIKGRYENYCTCHGPIIQADLAVQANGKVLCLPGTKVDTRYSVSGAFAKESLERLQNTGKSVEEASTLYRGFCEPLLDTAFLAISFLHCKNVILSQETYHRAGKEQLAPKIPSHTRASFPVSYHVLEIAPMREILRTEGKSETVGLKRALSICRGHFRHYENGRGLFGKYKGTFWVPMHVRGNREQGIALKDYRIKLEQ